DVGFGLHLPFDIMFNLLSEALSSFLKYNGFTIFDIGGVSFIIPDASISYKAEVHIGDILLFDIAATNFSEKSCDLFFQVTKKGGNKQVAKARIKIIFYDYNLKKAVPVPKAFRALF
ncbi:MAG: thioesterase family protein, partial [Leptospira sp.]|nr:thioesterase family protein [Leptospira sp.]